VHEEPLIAVFIDYENLAIGSSQMRWKDLEISLVLKRLLEKGRIVFRRAYCDWSQYPDAVRDLHTNGIELLDIPRSRMSGKNSADIRMVVDAVDLCYAKQHIDVFALLSGDSDFSPLVSKLKENNKRVIGCGVKSSTSNLLISACDEFIYYDDLVRTAQEHKQKKKAKKPPPKGKEPTDKKQEVADRVVEIVESLRADYEPLWGSMIKQTIRRVFPGFSEGYYGYGSFSEMLEAVEDMGYIVLDYDEERGNYIVKLPQTGKG
jgi:uncharacterized protein (TIGR00288 family)